MSLKLNSSGGGSVTIQEPTTASDFTLTLPAATGTVLTTATAGTVLQVVSATKLDIFSTTSTSFTDVTGLSVSITPSSATNKIIVFASVSLGSSSDDMLAQLVRDSTGIGNGTGGSVSNGFSMLATSEIANSAIAGSISFLDSPNKTTSTTYKVQVLVRSGTGHVNRRGSNASFGASSSITVMEIAA